jgi:hypothetical protein
MKKYARISTGILPVVLVLLVMVLVLPGYHRGGTGRDLHDPAPNRFGIYSPGSLAEVSHSGGVMMIHALGLKTIQDYEDYSIDAVSELGAGWVRIDFLFDGWHFVEPDYLDGLYDRGFEVMGTVRPVNNYMDSDLTRFESELRGLIDRNPRIQVWQIGNEPNLYWQPGDYARLFISGQKIVRQECPTCRIALAGVAARAPSRAEALSYYNTVLDLIDTSHDDARLFDIFDIHYYGSAGLSNDMGLDLDDFRTLLNRKGLGAGVELWVTETSTYSGSPVTPQSAPAQTEQQQASELVKRFITSFGAGLDRIAWSRPYENYRYHDMEESYYDHNALIYNGLGAEEKLGISAGTRKLAFYAYQILVGKLEGYSRAEKLAPGQYRFSFDDDRPPIYVLWDMGAAGLPDDLSGTVTVTEISGAVTKTDSDRLVVGPDPVFVETSEP